MRIVSVMICFSLVKFSLAQISIARSEISSLGGAHIALNGINYSYTVGGVVSQTKEVNNLTITEGFEQPLFKEYSELNIANAFSPDGDGVNESWIIRLPFRLQNNTAISVFNRWGDIIHSENMEGNSVFEWNGTYQNSGKRTISGTYFYVLENSSTQERYSGWVQVVRK